ncbi:MAG: ATP/GTP-binding protein [Verrucomicrobiaceae bacterium]|nr:ATP/GTP-binding protein [Verrucomicrobiaceae bacterium]
MTHRKIIFAGPVGAGKTTAICSLSEIAPIVTDARASDETRERKENTTVALDYGRITLRNGDRVHLYGTPGQDRFDFMWEILAKGGCGLILLMDNARNNPLADVKTYTTAFADVIKDQRLVIGVTRTDVKSDPGLEEYRELLDMFSLRVPVLAVDARKPADVLVLIETLLALNIGQM